MELTFKTADRPEGGRYQMAVKPEQGKNDIHMRELVRGLIFLAVFLVTGNIVLLIAADYGNHPYLFFLKEWIAWITGINPFLIGLLLWVFRRHSIICRLWQNRSEEEKEAAAEKERTSRKELIFMFAGLSLLFFCYLFRTCDLAGSPASCQTAGGSDQLSLS
jgi:Na+/H+ antiporter NhaD/arsenite permease-like protein